MDGDYEAYRRRRAKICCSILKIFLVVGIVSLGIGVLLNHLDNVQHPNPKAPAYSVLDVPLTTNDTGFTGGNINIILNARNQNKKKTNDYGTSEALLYFGDAAVALWLVANATSPAFFQPPLASTNLTLTFPAPAVEALGDRSTAVIKMKAQIRSSSKKEYGWHQVSCTLPYSSRLHGFDVSGKCDVFYQPPQICGIQPKNRAKYCIDDDS
ncbi:unnamed protein product [Cuscuta epithymum]|uniref:Late embryogenesis abundant protein LEA-2 subgroup domain-containing protein n=1 Tax=Cuscuta epithymum TaxID=186058 RepID=A0AAV0GD86_9ASTE|nr:unnamed protein product [Cuscuta epithymum]CAH9145589.1 unnamed protein product [Cuscuta epithymum]